VQKAGLSHVISQSDASLPALRGGRSRLQPLPAATSSVLVKSLWVKLKGRSKIDSPAATPRRLATRAVAFFALPVQAKGQSHVCCKFMD